METQQPDRTAVTVHLQAFLHELLKERREPAIEACIALVKIICRDDEPMPRSGEVLELLSGFSLSKTTRAAMRPKSSLLS